MPEYSPSARAVCGNLVKHAQVLEEIKENLRFRLFEDFTSEARKKDDLMRSKALERIANKIIGLDYVFDEVHSIGVDWINEQEERNGGESRPGAS